MKVRLFVEVEVDPEEFWRSNTTAVNDHVRERVRRAVRELPFTERVEVVYIPELLPERVKA